MWRICSSSVAARVVVGLVVLAVVLPYSLPRVSLESYKAILDFCQFDAKFTLGSQNCDARRINVVRARRDLEPGTEICIDDVEDFYLPSDVGASTLADCLVWSGGACYRTVKRRIHKGELVKFQCVGVRTAPFWFTDVSNAFY